MKALSKIIFTLTIGAGLSILLISLLIIPILDSVEVINVDIKQKKIELSVLDQQIRAFKTAQSDLARATRKEDVFNAIVTKENLVTPVLGLEKAAENTQTEESLLLQEPAGSTNVKSSKAKPPATVVSKQAGIDEITYKVAVNNDYAGIVNFLSYLEHLPQFTEISSIDLLSVDETSTDQASAPIHSGKIMGNFNGVFFIKTLDK